MSRLTVKIEDRELRELSKVLRATPQKVPKEIAIALNKTAKAHVTAIGKKIRETIAISAKGAKEGVETGPKASAGRLETSVNLKSLFRPSLKRFGARQVAAGVSYKIEKSGGRKLIKSAFGPNIPRLGGHVYTRKNPYVKGGNREANREIEGVKRGPSNLGVYLKKKMFKWSQKEIDLRLRKEIDRRVRAVMFRNSNR